MQLDMHYYGTFAMARAAGLDAASAQMIATCAEFVDDNLAAEHLELRDGSAVRSECTAHHPADCVNLEPEDQRRVWVPFHFIPGNIGESYTERLKCRRDSEIARELVEDHLERASAEYALALMGITAHVYADTFSHYGFSGVSSRRNKVFNDSFELDAHLDPQILAYITGKAERFRSKPGAQLLANIRSYVAEVASGALGHGAVATYPDRPYLRWSFEYELSDRVEGQRSRRDNQRTYLDGLAALHGMFARFAERRPDLCADQGRAFEDVRDRVMQILAVQGHLDARVQAWQRAALEGALFEGSARIPAYVGERWNAEWAALDGANSAEQVTERPIWRFYQAAAVHRTHVLRDLLPRYGLVVD